MTEMLGAFLLTFIGAELLVWTVYGICKWVQFARRKGGE